MADTIRVTTSHVYTIEKGGTPNARITKSNMILITSLTDVPQAIPTGRKTIVYT